MTTDERRFEAIRLAEQFWGQLWCPGQDPACVRSWVTPDVSLTTAGMDIRGVGPVVEWLDQVHQGLAGTVPCGTETFASVDAARVCTRWHIDEEGPAIRSAIGVWMVQWDRRMPRLARGWLELSRAALPSASS